MVYCCNIEHISDEIVSVSNHATPGTQSLG